MVKNLVISIIQSELHWENVDKNLTMFTEKLKNPELEDSHLIVLPEMFNTGFTMMSALFAEEMDGKTVNWMRKMAMEKGCVITGSLIIKENFKYYNRLVWMKPDGIFHFYDKRHLFRMAKENDHFTQGNERVILNIHGWKICPLICYDLRFPVWSRNRNDYDVLIYIANWPEKRNHAWKSLLTARAIENQSFVIGLNRVGTDGNEILYSGDSVITDYKGECIAASIPLENEVLTMELSYEDLQAYRKSFPAFMDADDFEIKL